MSLNNLAVHYGFVMRVFLAFVFVWFGISEIMDPPYFSGYVPPFIQNLPFYDAKMFIQVHGAILVFLSFCLIFKFYLKVTGLFAVLMLGQIIVGLLLTENFEINEIIVRDIGLLGLALSIWLNELKQK